MKTMSFSFSKAALAAALALTIVGCSSDNATKTDEVQAGGTADDATKNYFLAVDGDGYVNIYKDDGIATTSVGNFKVSAAGGVAAAGGLTLGEMHFHKGRAFVVIEEGLKNGIVDIGGGVAIIDVKAAIANPSGDVSTFLKIVPLTTASVAGVAGVPSRIVHTSVDPDGKYLWLNNDGPSDNTGEDSVFVIGWEHPTAADLAAYANEVKESVEEIAVGDGHKRSAFSHASSTKSGTPSTFATHNLSDETVSIIDNNPTSMDFRSVMATVTLKTINKINTPHGMDFSTVSGRFYTGITSGDDMGVAIIDPAKLPKMPSGLTTQGLTSIKAGMGSDQIPAAGYVHASHDGKYIYTVGYKENQGYLSIIQTDAGIYKDTDAVLQVIKLGDLKSTSLDISHMQHVENGITEHHVQILVPSGFGSEQSLVSKVAVIEIDHETGKLKGCDAAMCEVSGDGYAVKYINIGVTRGEHRNGEVTADGTRAIYPNNDCKDASVPATAANDSPDCKTINVIDVVTGAVTKMATAGRGPGSIGIVSKASVGVAPASGGGGGGGGHGH